MEEKLGGTGGYDPFEYGRSLGIEGLLGAEGFVYATSMGPIEKYEAYLESIR